MRNREIGMQYPFKDSDLRIEWRILRRDIKVDRHATEQLPFEIPFTDCTQHTYFGRMTPHSPHYCSR